MNGQDEQAAPQKPEPSRFNLNIIRESAEIIFRLGVVALAACYVIGLLILNLYLREYGIHHVALAQTDYVLVGALWLFLVGATYSVGAWVWSIILPEIKGWKESKSKWKSAIKLIIYLVLLVPMSGYALAQLGEGKISFLSFRYFYVVLLLFSSALTIYYIIYSCQGLVSTAYVPVAPYRRRFVQYFVFSQILALLLSLSLYATYVHPYLSPVYGGGMTKPMIFHVKSGAMDTIQTLGFSVSSNDRKLGPLENLFEAPDYFVVLPPDGFGKDVKSIRLNKDLFDAVIYPEKK